MSANSSFPPFLKRCFDSTTTNLIYFSFTVTNAVLLLPLFLHVVFLGLRQRRRRPASDSVSHSDFFTYNVVALELIGMVGSCLYSFGGYFEEQTLRLVGWSVCLVSSPGQTLFHVLTSVERYLAVVQPVTYLGLRQAAGLRLRNLSSGGTWLLCVVIMSCSVCLGPTFGYVAVSLLLVFSLLVVSLSGLSILRVLGQVGGAVQRVTRARRRAFHTVMAIVAALTLRFVGILLCNTMFASAELTDAKCAVGSSAVWLTLPGSLVLPLLFLQRRSFKTSWN